MSRKLLSYCRSLSTRFFALPLFFVAVAASSAATAQQPQARLLYRGTASYGWSHRGHASWGSNWQANAKNVAREEIRRMLASMVNLRDLDRVTGGQSSRAISGAGGGGTGRLAYADSKSRTERERWINGNNYLISIVGPVRLTNGWTKTSQSWTGKRNWQASATITYTYEIHGLPQGQPQPRPEAQQRAFNVTVVNQAGRSLTIYVRYRDDQGNWRTRSVYLNSARTHNFGNIAYSRQVGFHATGNSYRSDGGAKGVQAGDGRKYHVVTIGQGFSGSTYRFSP